MENLQVENPRSRSRPNTPFLRSSCDHENCLEGDDHVHVHMKSGRKTPVISRDTPTKIVPVITIEDITEEPESEIFTSPPAHRTRNALKGKDVFDPVSITSDYSSEELELSNDPKFTYLSKEASQNLTNSSYERHERITTTTSNSFKNGSGTTVSPGRYSRNSSALGHSRQYQASPSDSERSNESFADSVMADSCRMSVSGTEHLPSRLYREAREYWNKYPKTDYTYSRLSRDRVELAPGQVAVPNMSRQSLGNFRTMVSEENLREAMDSLRHAENYSDSSVRRRQWTSNSAASSANRHYNLPDSDWDEMDSDMARSSAAMVNNHWWITTLLIATWTTIVTTTTALKHKIFKRDPALRYPYYSEHTYAMRDKKKSWYTASAMTESVKKRKWWLLLLLLLLLPFLLFTVKPEYKEKLQSLEYPSLPAFVVPDFSGLSLSLPEFSLPGMPEISMPEFKMPNISMPFEMSLPDMSMPDSFHEYKSAADWWLFGWLFPSSDKSTVTIIEKPSKFELTEDMLRTIIMRVKESVSVDMKPQIIERVVEHTNTLDPTLLAEQRALIDSLYLEIDNLKEKLEKNDNIDDQINVMSARHSRDTLVKVFGLETKAGNDVTNEDIKAWLLKETLSRKDLEAKLADIKQNFAVDFDKIGDAVRMELSGLKEGLKSNIIARESVHSVASCDCDEMVNRIVAAALAVYDADKTGLVDYALESAGGQVVSTRCSESYQTSTAVYSVFGIPLWYPSNSPRVAITPGATPGDCWAFQGFPGYLLIKLYTRIDVTGFTMEHTPRQLTPNGQIESAPYKFSVWGLQDEMDHEPVLFGKYEYSNDSTALQYFPADIQRPPKDKPRGHELVELRIESNHGNPLYTCLYRFRVHGNPTHQIEFYGDSPDR